MKPRNAYLPKVKLELSPVILWEQECQHTRLVELHTLSVLHRRMAVDVIALLGVEVISIVGVRVIDERLLRAARLSIEGNSLPVAGSKSIFLVRLESLDIRVAGRIVINLENLLVAGAVTTTVGLDPNCKAALNEGGGGGQEELREMHFKRCSRHQECCSECKIERMVLMMLGTVWL